MAVRHPRPRGARALGLAAVTAAALLGGALADRVSSAQPASDLERAKELYQLAERAMKDSRFDDAARDYGASYELSKDPALFFKIGRANEGAGRCNVALSYYARYLRDGKPTAPFVATTRERIRACGGGTGSGAPGEPLPDRSAAPPQGATKPGETTQPGGTSAAIDRRPGGSAADGSAGSAAPPQGATKPGETTRPGGTSAAIDRRPGGSGAETGSAGSGSAQRPGAASAGSDADAAGAGVVAPAPPILVPTNRHKVAWVLTGGAIALTALGGILAVAASSSEADIRDLYVGFAGQPATFDAETRKRYDDLVDQGHRFQHLSWASFGVAGAAAAGAAVLFVLGGREETAQRARVTPVITPTSAGVAIGF